MNDLQQIFSHEIQKIAVQVKLKSGDKGQAGLGHPAARLVERGNLQMPKGMQPSDTPRGFGVNPITRLLQGSSIGGSPSAVGFEPAALGTDRTVTSALKGALPGLGKPTLTGSGTAASDIKPLFGDAKAYKDLRQSRNAIALPLGGSMFLPEDKFKEAVTKILDSNNYTLSGLLEKLEASNPTQIKKIQDSILGDVEKYIFDELLADKSAKEMSEILKGFKSPQGKGVDLLDQTKSKFPARVDTMMYSPMRSGIEAKPEDAIITRKKDFKLEPFDFVDPQDVRKGIRQTGTRKPLAGGRKDYVGPAYPVTMLDTGKGGMTKMPYEFSLQILRKAYNDNPDIFGREFKRVTKQTIASIQKDKTLTKVQRRRKLSALIELYKDTTEENLVLTAEGNVKRNPLMEEVFEMKTGKPKYVPYTVRKEEMTRGNNPQPKYIAAKDIPNANIVEKTQGGQGRKFPALDSNDPRLLSGDLVESLNVPKGTFEYVRQFKGRDVPAAFTAEQLPTGLRFKPDERGLKTQTARRHTAIPRILEDLPKSKRVLDKIPEEAKFRLVEEALEDKVDKAELDEFFKEFVADTEGPDARMKRGFTRRDVAKASFLEALVGAVRPEIVSQSNFKKALNKTTQQLGGKDLDLAINLLRKIL